MVADTIFRRQPSFLKDGTPNYGVVVAVLVLSVVVAVLAASGVVVAVLVASGVVVAVVVLVVDALSVAPLQADREATRTKLAAAKAIFL
ncbi:MAG: hypothetical protein IT342_18290 [Candidatus Melainabacteria bacterium]|nr:hypothetical protein [Candidatus Melainabacteria bacterium]